MMKRTVTGCFSIGLALFFLVWSVHLARSTAVSHTPGSVIISEVAWGGTAAGSSDEWIELYNNTDTPIDLTNWSLSDGGDINITLSGVIPANDFFLLERTDNNTVSDIPADDTYTGGLTNSGETLTLRDATDAVIDTANSGGGEWPAGTASPDYRSMERNGRHAPDDNSGWTNNNGVNRNGLDADGNPINGTPKANNSGWPAINEADLVLSKQGPTAVTISDTVVYEISVQNNGDRAATAVLLTDTLPTGLAYLADSSGLAPAQPEPGTLVWSLGAIPTDTLRSFHLTATIQLTTGAILTNHVTAVTTFTETNTANNRDTAVTTLLDPNTPRILIDALHYDGYATGDADEAVALYNAGTDPANVGGWQLSDGGESTAVLPDNTIIPPQSAIWISGDADAFNAQFGFPPDVTTTSWPGYANDGDEVALRDAAGVVMDVLVYKEGDTAVAGWTGTAVQPYVVSGVFAESGQILYRQRGQRTGLPLPDTHTAADWAQSRTDVIDGRKVRYPGWDLDPFFFTHQVTETAVVTIAIAPDNAYHAIVRQIDAAQSSLQIESLTFENLAIADALIRAAGRGVSVTVLLEGSPTGGLPDQEKHICRELADAGGACWFMISDETTRTFDRYRYLHAKFILVDGESVIISSENLSPNSLPADDKQDGTWGRRGVALITDAPGVVSHIQTVFDHDFDPKNHRDIFKWKPDHAVYGPPPPSFIPITQTGGITYAVRYTDPLRLEGVFPFEIVQSPENSLRDVDGLLGLVNRAGAGDTVLVQQLAERPYWGPSNSNPEDDPNPRLEAYLAAARRGATVRILLDAYFDDPTSPVSNTAACRYVQSIAQQERLDLACTLGNPAGLGIHNKMVLVEVNGRGYIHVGSLNGTEQSSKGNREVALQLQSDAAYALLADMFDGDWVYHAYLPVTFNNYVPPAEHILISEILYDPPGVDDAEFIELVNPTPDAIDLSFYSLGDAVHPTDFEDVRRFPTGTLLLPDRTLVVATTASAFQAEYGYAPHFEIIDTDPTVPDLLDDPAWGDPATFLQLGNQGDEVILRDPTGQPVDVVTYGTGVYPGVVACPTVSTFNYTLERFPYWLDTDDCPANFREWPFPNPGALP